MKFAYASAVAAGAGKPTAQDACETYDPGDGKFVLAVSDGAGSAPLSHLGARFAVREFCRGAVGDSPAPCVVRAIADRLKQVAEEDGRPPGEFAATLVGAVVGEAATTFVQVGDGIAVFRQGVRYEIAIEPEPSEFVNSTYFVTDADIDRHIRTRTVEGTVEEVALLTDGLQALVLHPDTQEPHDRFFETVFGNIRASCGHDEAASAWLAEMLGSDMVTRRTDDDTSIVAVRRGTSEC